MILFKKKWIFLVMILHMEKDNYTYHDIVGDLIVFEKMKERKK